MTRSKLGVTSKQCSLPSWSSHEVPGRARLEILLAAHHGERSSTTREYNVEHGTLKIRGLCLAAIDCVEPKLPQDPSGLLATNVVRVRNLLRAATNRYSLGCWAPDVPPLPLFARYLLKGLSGLDNLEPPDESRKDSHRAAMLLNVLNTSSLVYLPDDSSAIEQEVVTMLVTQCPGPYFNHMDSVTAKQIFSKSLSRVTLERVIRALD